MIIRPLGAPLPEEPFTDENLTFVWGFLMAPRFIRKLLGHKAAFAPAVLKGWKRSADGDSFQLKKQKDGVVSGVVLIGLSKKDVEKLDAFEQIPDVMIKRRTNVLIGDRKVGTFIYLNNK
ncbi:MAG: gamma-glutamylcyclotransferase family protein [bacterium]